MRAERWDAEGHGGVALCFTFRRTYFCCRYDERDNCSERKAQSGARRFHSIGASYLYQKKDLKNAIMKNKLGLQQEANNLTLLRMVKIAS